MTAGIGVMMGAFGAHALKARISPESLDVLKTGVLYLFVHSLATFGISIMGLQGHQARMLKFTGIIFLIGILLFSGSLFLISTREVTGLDISMIGIITPFGGMCFLTGWLSLAFWRLGAGKRS